MLSGSNHTLFASTLTGIIYAVHHGLHRCYLSPSMLNWVEPRLNGPCKHVNSSSTRFWCACEGVYVCWLHIACMACGYSCPRNMHTSSCRRIYYHYCEWTLPIVIIELSLLLHRLTTETRTHTHTHTHTHTNMHTYTHTPPHPHTHTNTCTHTYTNTHNHMHTHIHMHPPTHPHTCLVLLLGPTVCSLKKYEANLSG